MISKCYELEVIRVDANCTDEKKEILSWRRDERFFKCFLFVVIRLPDNYCYVQYVHVYHTKSELNETHRNCVRLCCFL